MPFDGIFLSTLITELKNNILEGRIQNIYQPEDDEIRLSIRNAGITRKLLITSNSNNPRIHFVNINKENPLTPPNFCMFLRKHIQGGKIIDIYQNEFERIFNIDIQSRDDFGYISIKSLIIEIMGRHSNIILVDKATNTILDSIKKVSKDINRFREIAPGIIYKEPPTQSKLNPTHLNIDIFDNSIQNTDQNMPVYKFLYTNIQGLSPILSREICIQSNINDETSIHNLNKDSYTDVINNIKDLVASSKMSATCPTIFINKTDQNVIDFYFMKLIYYAPLYDELRYKTINEALEDYYYKKDFYNRLKQKSSDLNRFVNQTISKLNKKKQKLFYELKEAENSKDLKIKGELLTSNIYKLEKGMSEIELINFYDNNETISIPLNINFTPSQNIQKYFKKYKKSKTALIKINQQLDETNEELYYFENLLLSILNANNVTEIEEIRTELIEEKYLRNRNKKNNSKKKNSSKKKISSSPETYVSSDGFKILVGKNNKQNDFLTLKIASKNDLWFHTKDIPGSHVVIKTENKTVPERTILEASSLAAFNSKARLSSNVPIDYTKIKNVKKPSGAKPGMVIYVNNKTIYVTPDQKMIENLKKE